MPQAPEQQRPPAPMPPPAPSKPLEQRPVQMPMFEEECEESPIFHSQGPPTMQLPSQMPSGWELLESPDLLCDEESPEFDMSLSAPCPPGPGYVPQPVSPMWGAMPGQHALPQSFIQQGCGCGGHHAMMIPMYYGQPCSCNSGMMPYPMMPMPMPYQGSTMYGAY